MTGDGGFRDALEVREHLAALPEVSMIDPGGNTYWVRLCPRCSVALVAREQDGTLFIDDAATVLGAAPAAPPPPGGSPGCRCAELVGRAFPFPADHSPYAEEL